MSINNVKTKKTLFARPTAAIEVCPKLPIITVSTRFKLVFNKACSAIGIVIAIAFFIKVQGVFNAPV